jgi:basic amino acid/polyamine antiporter, APA family
MNKPNIFRTKSIIKIQHELIGGASAQGVALKRHLGATSLVLFGIGVLIGAGIFSLTGMAAGQYAGPGIVLSFGISAVACALAGLCYAEFASMVPTAGSAYTYAYTSLGELFAWIIGWDLVLEYAAGAATVATSWSAYLMKFCEQIGVPLPAQWAASPFDVVTFASGVQAHAFFNLPAAFIVVAMSLVLIKGIRESAMLNAVLVVLKLVVILAFIGLGWKWMNPANHHPFVPANTGAFGHFGWSGVFRGSAVIFFAYIGFDAVSTAAQEAKNPRRDMPIGILGSLIVCTALYCTFSYVLTGLANYKEFSGLSGLAPVAIAISHTPYKFFTLLVELAILAGFSSVIMILLLGQSRVFYSMSQDGLLPAMFSELHPKFSTPWKSNILFAVFVSLFAGLVPGHVIGEMTSIGTLLAFVIVCISVPILRRTMPNAPRAFLVPFVPWIPIAGALCCLAIMASLPLDTWIRLVVWLVIGCLLYFSYSRWNSRLHREQEPSS